MALKKYEVTCEGVVSRIQVVEAENVVEASEKARRAFSNHTGTGYHSVAAVDIYKTPSELELDLMRRKGL